MSATGATPSGRVKIRRGTSLVGKCKLRKGRCTVVLKRQRPGRTTYVASYAGRGTVAGSTRKVKIRVR